MAAKKDEVKQEAEEEISKDESDVDENMELSDSKEDPKAEEESSSDSDCLDDKGEKYTVLIVGDVTYPDLGLQEIRRVMRAALTSKLILFDTSKSNGKGFLVLYYPQGWLAYMYVDQLRQCVSPDQDGKLNYQCWVTDAETANKIMYPLEPTLEQITKDLEGVEQQDPTRRTLHVRGFATSETAKSLKKVFTEASSIIFPQTAGKSRGYAYVEMENEDMLDNFVEKHNESKISDKVIFVRKFGGFGRVLNEEAATRLKENRELFKLPDIHSVKNMVDDVDLLKKLMAQKDRIQSNENRRKLNFPSNQRIGPDGRPSNPMVNAASAANAANRRRQPRPNPLNNRAELNKSKPGPDKQKMKQDALRKEYASSYVKDKLNKGNINRGGQLQGNFNNRRNNTNNNWNQNRQMNIPQGRNSVRRAFGSRNSSMSSPSFRGVGNNSSVMRTSPWIQDMSPSQPQNLMGNQMVDASQIVNASQTLLQVVNQLQGLGNLAGAAQGNSAQNLLDSMRSPGSMGNMNWQANKRSLNDGRYDAINQNKFGRYENDGYMTDMNQIANSGLYSRRDEGRGTGFRNY